MKTPSTQQDSQAAIFQELNALLRMTPLQLRRYTDHFAEQLRSVISVDHVIPVGSGTDGLFHALYAFPVKGKRVITTANSWASCISTIVEAGAEPQFVDVDIGTGQLSADALETAIDHRTAGVLLVHMYGIPADIRRIKEICARRGIFLIEDACQCFGVEVDGKWIGTHGDVGIFSFHPAKRLGAPGSGGAIVTNDVALAKRISLNTDLRWNVAINTIQPRCPSRLIPMMIPFIRSALKNIAMERSFSEDRWRELINLAEGRSTEFKVLGAGLDRLEKSWAILFGPGASSLREKMTIAGVKPRVFYEQSSEFVHSLSIQVNLPNTLNIVSNHLAIGLTRKTSARVYGAQRRILNGSANLFEQGEPSSISAGNDRVPNDFPVELQNSLNRKNS